MNLQDQPKVVTSYKIIRLILQPLAFHYIYIYIYMYVSITFTLFLWDLSSLCVVAHLYTYNHLYNFICELSTFWFIVVIIIVMMTWRTHCFRDYYLPLPCFCEIWALCALWITYDHLHCTPCLDTWAFFGSLAPEMCNRTSCA